MPPPPEKKAKRFFETLGTLLRNCFKKPLGIPSPNYEFPQTRYPDWG